MRKFAPDYKRNSDGLVLFPPDRNLRALLFPYTDPTEHIAKCLAPETLVLKSNLTWIELSSIKVGDRLIGIDEQPNFSKGRKVRRLYREAIVEAINQVHSTVAYAIELEDGTNFIAGDEHPWLRKNTSTKVGEWKKTASLKRGDFLVKILDTWKVDNSREAGYLAGFFDGEGSVAGNCTVSFAQLYGNTFNYVKDLLCQRGYSLREGSGKTSTGNAFGRIFINKERDTLQFLGEVRPLRLLENFSMAKLEPNYEWVKVVSVTKIPIPLDLIDIATSTKTFIAEGFVTHNSNMLMVKALVEFVSEEGEIIFDPFAGTGTIMVALTLNRKVVMIELEEHFVKTIESNIKGISNIVPNAEEHTLFIPGDAFIILPVTDVCDHMIFSPPYPQGLKKKGSMDKTSQDLGYAAGTLYSSNPNNLTNYNTFMYHQKIEQFYKKCLLTVKDNGTMTVIIKDKVEGGARQRQPERTIRDCEKLGWKLYAHNKWYARGGGYSEVNRAHGLETVDEESLITFIKPG